MIRGVAFFSCLLFVACDRGNDDISSNKAASSPRVSGAERVKLTPEERQRELRAAAMRDPELRKMQTEVDEKLADGEDFDPFGPMDTPVEALAVLYAQRFPEAGAGWILSLRGESYSMMAVKAFMTALYQQDPERVFRMLEEGPPAGRELFLAGAAVAVGGADIERLWGIVLEPTEGVVDRLLPKRFLILNQACTDPMGAWEVTMARMGPEYPMERFLKEMPKLAEGVVFPTALLDEIAPRGMSVDVLEYILDTASMENSVRIGEWLEARGTKPEFDESYMLLTMKYLRNGDMEAARKWAGRVTTPRLRNLAEELFEKEEAGE